LFVLLLLAVCARAAVVEGVVLDEETGNPLARTKVVLVPLPGTAADITGVPTAERGSFVILNVRPGWYVLRATRRGYEPAESGQLRPGRPGRAFEVVNDRASDFIEIHMSHLPAITGTVLDENGVGIPRWTVHIYTSGKPIRHVAQVDTDDRGNYRFGELEPGSYLLRSTEGHYEDDTAVLATYSRSSVELGNAVPQTVRVGETAHDITIRPIKGRLLTLSGIFYPLGGNGSGGATLTMITDTGRREILSASEARPFSVTGVQPGAVEFLVKGDDGFGNECGGYSLVAVDKDVSTLRPSCNPLRRSSISISGAIVQSPITVRRVDLDGATEAHPIARDEDLAPGHWEIRIPRGDYYVMGVRASGSPASSAGGWWGFDTGSDARVTIQLSSRPASISGVVSTGGSPVGGAPVFLTQINSGEVWTARSDPQGNYTIGGLAPATYSIVSGFDMDMNGGSVSRHAETVSTAEGGVTMQALELVLP